MSYKKQNRLRILFQKYLQNTCTVSELEEFWSLMNKVSEDDEVAEDIQAVWGRQNILEAKDTHPDWNALYRTIQAKAQEQESSKEIFSISKGVIQRRWLAAASVILLIGLGIGAYTWMKPSKQLPPIAKATMPNDILAPTNSRAMITLADGSQVFLDSLNNGAVATQGNVQLVKLANGQIAYNPTSQITDHRSPITYNTLTNPRGSKVIDMKLSDGTHIWLNAGSSITYPVAFAGNERKVTLSGEGYFEVAHDASKPFHVEVEKMDVQVLGTHFNVNAYQDEEEIKTTLIQGSVKIVSGKNSKTIKPGEQASVMHGKASEIKIAPADVEEAIAWKNGFFHFNKSDLQEVMRQLSRWYNVEVEYQGDIPKREFGGEIQRNLKLSQVLILLAKSSVNFKIEGNKLIVMP
ncbi:MAG: FecR domain-containing protein [Bacteroidetes bacterium]|nr:FecR domain-containing protein [Bacteroidota bacterium]